MNFIAESKRQIMSDAQDTIKKVEQWQRQTCAMFDMVQQHIVHNLQDDRHESIAVKNVKKTSIKKPTVKKPTAIAKKPSLPPKKSTTIARKPSVLGKKPPSLASKTSMKKPSTKIGTAKKRSSIIRKVVNSSKQNAHCSAQQILDCLPDLSSDSSSEQSTEDVLVTEKVACPSMPSMLSFDLSINWT